jgi:hypothetical protein
MENELGRIEEFSNRLNHAEMVESSSSRRHRAVLFNPAKIKAIASAKPKISKVDVPMLASLLLGGYITKSYVPSRRAMSLRELFRCSANLVRMGGTIVNRVHAHLLMNNVKMDYGLFTKVFLEYQ